MPIFHHSLSWQNSPGAKQKQSRFDSYWRTFLCHANKTSLYCQPYILRSYDEGLKILQWALWKHHFSPIDTSNALAWLTIPAYYVVPQRDCISQLPIELLNKIFAHVLHSDSRMPQDRFRHEIQRRISSGTSPTTPLHMAHVSRFWLEVVDNAPVLWSTIKVVCPTRKDVEYVTFLLGKTGKCPLDLTLEQYTTPDPASLAIAKLFVSHAHRWRRITFVLFQCIQDAFSGLKPGDVGYLEDYRIRINSWDSNRIESFMEVLHSSTKLEVVDWGKSIIGKMKGDLHWHRLSEITLHCMELSHSALITLSQCESLKTLRMRRIQRSDDDLVLPLTLNKLERLICDRLGNLGAMFDCLTLPALIELEITNRNELLKRDADALKGLLVRSRSSLETISLDGHSLHILSSIASFLATTTTLNILSDVEDIDCLKKPEGAVRAEILPNLQNLIIHNIWCPDGILADVVWSRRNQLLKIQVCMIAPKARAPQDYLTLGWLEKDGVLVFVHDPVPRYSTFYLRGNSRDQDSDVVPMVHFPDSDTFW